MRWRPRGRQPPNRSRERRRNRPRSGSWCPRRQCHPIPLSELVPFRYTTVVHGAIGGTTTLNAKRRKAGVAQHPEDIATSTRWRTRTRPRPSVPPRPLDQQLRRGRIIPGAVGPPTVAKWSFDPANLREHHCTRDCLHVADNIQLISGRFYQRSSGMGGVTNVTGGSQFLAGHLASWAVPDPRRAFESLLTRAGEPREARPRCGSGSEREMNADARSPTRISLSSPSITPSFGSRPLCASS